jgi:ABC-2 type transport system permease protein
MGILVHCLCSDFYKFRHTFLLWIHLFLPIGFALLAVIYCSVTVSALKAETDLRTYLELIGSGFPVVAGLLCSKSADLESEAGNFQVIMSGTVSRSVAYLSKLFSLLISGACSVVMAVGLFGVFFRRASFSFYILATVLLICSSVFLYLLHLFVSFRFGGGASIGLGIFETLVALLALTGLGDGIWYCIPCTWGSRLEGTLTSLRAYPNDTIFLAEVRTWILIAAPMTILALVFSLIWFKQWEGRKGYE